MIIQITDADLKQMPLSLSADLLQWVQSKHTKDFQQNSPSRTTEAMPQQLDFNVVLPVANPTKSQKSTFDVVSQFASIREAQPGFSQDLRENSHVRISQLFDMGLLSQKTQIRVRLKQDRAKQVGYSYVVNVQISSRGTVIYENEEFDKPSPLATKANGGSVNGWEYIEIKQNGQWVCLNELRRIWRNAS